MKHTPTLVAALLALMPAVLFAADPMIKGTPIGTISVDYSTGQSTYDVNGVANAFDGDLNTCYAAYARSFGWVGLELDQPYVVTRLGYAARNDQSVGERRMELGVFQGANSPDFSDAMPIYLIPEYGKIGEMIYVDVDCSKGFRYLRYVGPSDARCNVGEIAFYGHPGEGDDSRYYQPTNLPLVVVNTPGMEWFHSDKSYAMEGSQIYIIDGGKIDTGATGQIRGRGNASWNFPKKPFRIKFDKKQKVLGGPAKAKKWTMINNYGDKTLMRNMLAFEASRRIGMDFTPVCHPVDLIFNGEYQGCYQLCDQIEVASDRVDITKMTPEDIEMPALSGGYLIEIDAYASSEPEGEWFTSQSGHSIPVTIKAPDPGITQQYNYIRSMFTQLERKVFASNYKDFNLGYRSNLDLDSFLKHFIVGEFAGNTDTYWSVYMTLDRGSEKFRTGPCWDFDLGFNNDNRTYPVNDKNDFVCFSGSFANGMEMFVRRIIKNDASARERLRYLWSEARVLKGYTEEEFVALVDEYAAMLDQSQRLNFKRWPILNQYVHQNPAARGSYAAEVKAVRSYVAARFAKLDALIGRVEIDAVEDVAMPEVVVQPFQGGISIEGESPYAVCTLQGVVVASGCGSATVSLPAGIYLVQAGNSAHKICVK